MTAVIYFYNPETGEYPRYLGDIQLIDPNWNDTQPLPEPWVEVLDIPIPTLTANQVYEDGEPIKNKNGTYKRNIIIRDRTAEELRAIKLYEIKNKVFVGIKLTQEEAALLTE